MVALDSSPDFSPAARMETAGGSRIILFCALVAVLVAGIGFSMGEEGTGWTMAGDWVSRFGLLVFVAAMSVESLAHLIPTGALKTLAEQRTSLVLGFIAAMIVSLGCVVAPWLLSGERLGAPTMAYVALTGMILTVMLFTSHPATIRLLGAPSWRAMQRVAAAYFWAVFALSAMGRLIGPHQPDNWHGAALLLLTATLLLRFADAFVMHWRSRVAEKVG